MNDSPLILLVDDNEDNIRAMERPLRKKGYRLLKAMNGYEALSITQEKGVDLILLDIMMPGITGFEVCRQLKQSRKYQLIPIVLVTALNQVQDRIEGIKVGADDFISKPFNREELLARVDSLLRIKSLTDQLDSAETVIFSLAEAVEARDHYTRGHTERVGKVAVSIGKEMGFSQDELENLRKGGILHDIGKIGVPDNILNKSGRLKGEELKKMKKHPQIGYDICKHLKTAKGLLDIILHHHEKMDGSGYPHGLQNVKISLPVRIMTVADIFDALISDRPYRKGLSLKKVYSILEQKVSANLIDPEVIYCLKLLKFK